MLKYQEKKFILIVFLVFITVPLVIGQSHLSRPAEAGIFFLDLGIVIEPATGSEVYSRLVEAPSQEVKINIKKAESGSIYMASSQAMRESLQRIQEKIDQLENTFKREISLIQKENKELKDIIADIIHPPLRKPERPQVFITENNGFDDDPDFEDMKVETRLSILEMPPLMLGPVIPARPFNQLAYMSAVFAYQREEYKDALNCFSSLSLVGANQQTVGNILYWMADCCRQGEDYNSALILLDKLLVVGNSGREADALIQKGLIYRELGKEELAMIMFRDLVDDYPGSDYARLVSMELNSVESYQ